MQVALLKARGDQARGLPILDERQTIKQFLTDWLEHKQSSVRFSTHRSYEQTVRNHLIPELGHLKLSKLQPQHIDQMLKRELDAGLSPRSTAYLRVVLRAALNRARKRDLVARNAAELADAPRMERYKVKPLTPEQARLLLDTAKGHRLEALYTVALACGFRRGEILGLHWRDVDFEHSRMSVSQALQRQKGRGLVLTETKTDRSRRTIELPPPLVTALRAHRVRQLEERMAAGPEWHDHGFVFASTVGTGLEPRNLTRAFKALLKRAAPALPDIRFHDLRHSAATLLLVQGVELRVVQEVLGHSSISLTANTYAHVMPVLIQDAAGRSAELLFPQRG